MIRFWYSDGLPICEKGIRSSTQGWADSGLSPGWGRVVSTSVLDLGLLWELGNLVMICCSRPRSQRGAVFQAYAQLLGGWWKTDRSHQVAILPW